MPHKDAAARNLRQRQRRLKQALYQGCGRNSADVRHQASPHTIPIALCRSCATALVDRWAAERGRVLGAA